MEYYVIWELPDGTTQDELGPFDLKKALDELTRVAYKLFATDVGFNWIQIEPRAE